MVGVVQLAEHRIVVPGVVGSRPITPPRKKKGDLLGLLSFFRVVMGLEEPGHGKAVANNMPVAFCLGRGESLDAGVRSDRIVKRHPIFMS